MGTQYDLYEFVPGEEVERHPTLRNTIVEYRNDNDMYWDNSRTPELTIAYATDRISSMTKFDTCIGSMRRPRSSWACY